MAETASVRGTMFVHIPNHYSDENPKEQGRIRVPTKTWVEQIKKSSHGLESGISCAFSTATDSPDTVLIAFIQEEDTYGQKCLFSDPDIFGFEADLNTLRGLHRALGYMISELEAMQPK